MPRSVREDYRHRLNRSIDLVVEHLADDLSLERLANAAGFSPFHFHRLFKTLMGESVKTFTQRVRLERAMVLLKTCPRLNLKQVAAACGFGSPAVFSRAFRRAYGVAPSTVEMPAFLANRKNRQEFPIASRYHLRSFPREEKSMTVTVERFPERPVLYLRANDSYQSDAVPRTFQRLIDWAADHGLSASNAELLGMSFDDPEVTPLKQCSYDVALQVPAAVPVPAEFSRRTIPAGQFAVCRCRGDIQEVDRGWNYLFKVWLPRSRWQPANFPAIERFVRWPGSATDAAWDLEATILLAPL